MRVTGRDFRRDSIGVISYRAPMQEQLVVAELTVQLLRGAAMSDVLYRRPTDPDALMRQWARMVRCQLSSQEENQ